MGGDRGDLHSHYNYYMNLECSCAAVNATANKCNPLFTIHLINKRFKLGEGGLLHSVKCGIDLCKVDDSTVGAIFFELGSL